MPFFSKKSSNLPRETSPKESRQGSGKDATENSVNEKVSSPKNKHHERAQNSTRSSNADGQSNSTGSPSTRDKNKKHKNSPKSHKPSAVPPADPHSNQPAPPRFVFYCQLAHGSATAKVEGFTNVKQLYEKIAAAFHIKDEEILFCTLNTYRVDMDRLLGGQIGLDDFIFAHVKGQVKTVEVLKDQPSLGLTITDNGAGCAFIKRIKEGSIADKEPQICVGDHVETINDISVVGKRHFDVARMLREVGVEGKISFRLVEPQRTFEGIGPRTSTRGGQQAAPAEGNAQTEKAVGSGKATLRLKSKGPPVVENIVDTAWEQVAMKKVDDLLESFLGIRDEELASNLVTLSQNKENPSDFAVVVDEEYADFEFPDDFIFDLWGVISDAKKGRI